MPDPAHAVPPDGAGAHAPAIRLVQANSLSTLVQREIERLILVGDLAAGSKLTEASIAEMLGVSRGPVREAFRALEGSGLVRIEKNRGVYVRQIAIDEADQIYEMRAVLDEFVGRRLASTATPAQVAELREILSRMDEAAARNDVDRYLAGNLDLHDRMVELTGNAKLLLVYRRLVNELHLFRRTALMRGGVLDVSSREHRDMVDRIAAGDVDGAGRALRDHVMASRARMHVTYDERGVVAPIASASDGPISPTR
ncbi:MAG TPA: phosphonate utilization associated transcriptional regulator [Casimicrobiaceae bacterium]|nr:phosphonate utilization associated transcriptional regulator [Casimicrobiaceae bacterium]